MSENVIKSDPKVRAQELKMTCYSLVANHLGHLSADQVKLAAKKLYSWVKGR